MGSLHASQGRRRLGAGLVLVVAAMTAATGTALAACPSQPMTRAFAQFGDGASYWPAPGGDFEAGLSSWETHGEVTTLPGNEPFEITPGASALRIGRGATAVSPPVCVDLASPTFRFVSRPEGLGLLVAVLQSRRDGGPWLDVISLATPGLTGSPWAPTLPHPLAGGLPIGRDGTAEVRIKLTAAGAAWRVDSVMIDPYRTR